jgi:hypothetical protein
MQSDGASAKLVKSVQQISQDLSACYLSSTMFTVGGVVLGSIAATRSKNIKYLGVGAFVGTSADVLYGFSFLCKELQNDYQRARNEAYLRSREEEQKILSDRKQAIDNKNFSGR